MNNIENEKVKTIGTIESFKSRLKKVDSDS